MAHALTRLHVEKHRDITGWVLLSVNLSTWFRGFSHTHKALLTDAWSQGEKVHLQLLQIIFINLLFIIY